MSARPLSEPPGDKSGPVRQTFRGVTMPELHLKCDHSKNPQPSSLPERSEALATCIIAAEQGHRFFVLLNARF